MTFFFVFFFVFCFFFNAIIEIVTLRLCGWCMLGVLLLTAVTCLGHECRDLLSRCNGMHAQTRSQFILSSKRVLGNGVRNHVNSKTKIPSTRGSKEVRTHDTASGRTVSPTHYQLSYCGPHFPIEAVDKEED